MKGLPTIIDLFSNGEKIYYLTTENGLDNVESLTLFIEEIDGLRECVTDDNGTQIHLNHKDFAPLIVDSGGGGDFFSHVFDVSFK
ncbi:MAG: hypothetical protein AB8G11_16690 [Saprospiraceae bacterium]